MTTELRILTVRHPWSHAIIWGEKDVENRVRNIAGSYRGPIAVHAAARVNPIHEWIDFERAHPHAARAVRNAPGDLDTFGAIIGVVDLVDVHKCAGTPTNRPRCYKAKANGFTEAVKAGTGLCSPWADQFAENHLVLANPRPLREPIQFRGALGLRRLDDTTTAAVWSQIGARP